MGDAQTTAIKCTTCGAELRDPGDACLACSAQPEPETDTEITEVRVVGEVMECEGDPECAKGALWIRLVAATIYALVGAACAYGSVAFFRRDITSSSDWVFGAMAIGLTFIALIGIKESLFSSGWKPE